MTTNDSDVNSGRSSTKRQRYAYPRLAIGIGATVLLAFAFIGFFHPVGLAAHEYWWLMIVAMGAAVIGASASTVWQKAGLVAATFLIGLGTQLAMKEPAWFQYINIRPSSYFGYVLLAAIVLQAATAALVLSRKNIFKHVFRVFSALGWMRVFGFSLVLFVGSIGAIELIAHHDYGALARQLFVASAFIALNIASLAALALAAPGDQLSKISVWVMHSFSLPGSGGQPRKHDTWLPIWLASGVFVICVFMRLIVFDNVPRIDEVLYLFQANYFAEGRLTLPMPPSTEAFDVFMMDTHHGRWFATWPPGWPAVLAIGAFFGTPWIINPLLAAVSILLLHSFLTAVADRGMANLTTLLLSLSPWFLCASSTLMSHTLTSAVMLARGSS